MEHGACRAAGRRGCAPPVSSTAFAHPVATSLVTSSTASEPGPSSQSQHTTTLSAACRAASSAYGMPRSSVERNPIRREQEPGWVEVSCNSPRDRHSRRSFSRGNEMESRRRTSSCSSARRASIMRSFLSATALPPTSLASTTTSRGERPDASTPRTAAIDSSGRGTVASETSRRKGPLDIRGKGSDLW